MFKEYKILSGITPNEVSDAVTGLLRVHGWELYGSLSITSSEVIIPGNTTAITKVIYAQAMIRK